MPGALHVGRTSASGGTLRFVNVVQYRTFDPSLGHTQTAIPKGDASGRMIVTGEADAPLPIVITPDSLASTTLYRTAGPTFYETQSAISAVSVIVELLYVQLGATLLNAAPLYALVIDKNSAVAASDGSAVPFPKMTVVGEMIVWEPPGGFLFANGVRVIVSSTPNIYTAPGGGAEPISVVCRTRAA